MDLCHLTPLAPDWPIPYLVSFTRIIFPIFSAFPRSSQLLLAAIRQKLPCLNQIFFGQIKRSDAKTDMVYAIECISILFQLFPYFFSLPAPSSCHAIFRTSNFHFFTHIKQKNWDGKRKQITKRALKYKDSRREKQKEKVE